MSALTRPEHGGDLLAFARRTGRRMEECLDLSTAISPWSWSLPLEQLPVHLWQRLPSASGAEAELLAAASTYYGCQREQVLAVPGSQAAIEWLPRIFTPDRSRTPIAQNVPTSRRGPAPGARSRVAVPALGYAEHAYHWQQAGAELRFYQSPVQLGEWVAAGQVERAVVIEPNNPTADYMGAGRLRSLAAQLAERGGCLIVDQAFADACPEPSLSAAAGSAGLIILRSLGKFFGLAGLRLGFVLAAPATLKSLAAHRPLWSLPAPTCWLGTRALADAAWIAAQHQRLQQGSARLQTELTATATGLRWVAGPGFVSGAGDAWQVERLAHELAAAAIMSRVYRALDGDAVVLRLGLPAATDWPRLSAALRRIAA
ncbi:MAG: aminotransferase class I/II-fold pyridoxal phosphate-dependent enzyme [Cellvibrionales bacterium]|nr:aminotransferase class I/II-fold pyridoxal phosphate-dependent enzyme [Cellvibrionales bacterium]